MSATFAIRFTSGRQLRQVLEEANPGLDPWNYVSTLGSGAQALDVVADGAGVDLWRFRYEDPEDFEYALPYLELPEPEIRTRREALAAQTEWHPIPAGIAVFNALTRHIAEHPGVVEARWVEPLTGAMRTVVLGMEAALEQGETGFHLSVG